MVTRGSWRKFANVMRTRRSASSSSDPVPSSPSMKTHQPKPPSEVGHKPVLLHEVLELLNIQSDDVVVDATVGGGGHARALVEKLKGGTFVGIDADGEAIKRVKKLLENETSLTSSRVHLVRANFRELHEVLARLGVGVITKALFDLGWSSYQLSAGRGFSFLNDEPLLMTFSSDITPGTLTAETIVNTWEESSIADVLYGWGEERYARRIARAIIEARKKKPIQTSRELADVVSSAVPTVYRRGKIHPATRTFQALRIAVNDELGALKHGLETAWKALEHGGRIAVISFHSVEDREVKRLMRGWEKSGEGRTLMKSPVVASREEVRTNPRSRSAKLRVIQKI